MEDGQESSSHDLSFAALSSQLDETIQLLDFSVTRHMTGSKKMLEETQLINTQTVIFGDNMTYNVTKIGRVPITLKDSNIRYHISNVFLVPNIKMNFLSINQMDKQNLDVLFRQGIYRITNYITSKLMATGHEDDGLYKLDEVPLTTTPQHESCSMANTTQCDKEKDVIEKESPCIHEPGECSHSKDEVITNRSKDHLWH